MTPCPTPGKQAHRTEAEAWAHLASLRRKDGGFHVEVYRCVCGRWHVGHHPRKHRRQRGHSW